MSFLDKIDKDKVPQHVAIIMDGNGRWAKAKGMPRVVGHREGVNTVREISEIAVELNVKYLTLYAFSTENWNRPALEVNALMSLLVSSIKKEMNSLMKNGIKLCAIGDIKNLHEKSYKSLKKGIEDTKNNEKLTLILALNYSGKWDILNAINTILKDGNIKEVDEDVFSSYLDASQYPDPELMIRTGGEMRLSNFLLWESAYSELYFTDVKWPEFDKEAFCKAIYDYQNRERRFGKISEQLT
ncbi:MAG: isoprenyl transferase [Saprospiraceae bacterium]